MRKDLLLLWSAAHDLLLTHLYRYEDRARRIGLTWELRGNELKGLVEYGLIIALVGVLPSRG